MTHTHVSQIQIAPGSQKGVTFTASLLHVYRTAVNVTPFRLSGEEFIFKANNQGGNNKKSPHRQQNQKVKILQCFTQRCS